MLGEVLTRHMSYLCKVVLVHVQCKMLHPADTEQETDALGRLNFR